MVLDKVVLSEVLARIRRGEGSGIPDTSNYEARLVFDRPLQDNDDFERETLDSLLSNHAFTGIMIEETMGAEAVPALVRHASSIMPRFEAISFRQVPMTTDQAEEIFSILLNN